MERRRRGGESFGEELRSRGRQIEGQEKWGKINKSKYNTWYKYLWCEGIPRYLGRRDKKKEWWGRIARFRLGNEMRIGRYWE